MKRARGHVLERVHVHLCFSWVTWPGNRLGTDLDQILPMGKHVLLGHPKDVSGELIGDLGTGFRRDQHVAARNIDLVGEDEGDRLPRHQPL